MVRGLRGEKSRHVWKAMRGEVEAWLEGYQGRNRGMVRRLSGEVEAWLEGYEGRSRGMVRGLREEKLRHG